MKIKKSYLILIISVLILLIGVSFAYFSLEITGNDTAKYNTITTGALKLTFTDTNALTLTDALPGDSATKTISVKNTGFDFFSQSFARLLAIIFSQGISLSGF